MVVFENIKLDEVKVLGFEKQETKTPYEVVRVKGEGCVLTLYNSGKLVVQGGKDAVDNFCKRFGRLPQKQSSYRREEGWVIGSDESLKGDTFGGIVVAAVRADNDVRKKLKVLGVADSKKLADREILSLAEEVRKFDCCVISLLPGEYNAFKGNQTRLLDKLHKDCAKLGSGLHVVDKYPGCGVGDVRVTKGEEKYIEIAAASILARAAALEQFVELSERAGFPLPKGSTHVKDAIKIIKEKNLPLKDFLKVSFRNV